MNPEPSNLEFVPLSSLESGLDVIRQSPKDGGVLQLIEQRLPRHAEEIE